MTVKRRPAPERKSYSGTSLCLLLIAGLTACGGSDGEASCILNAEYHGKVYVARGVERLPELGGPVGQATIPPCNDTNQDPSREHGGEITVTAIVGVSPEVAIAWEDSILFAPGVTELPTPSPSQ